VARGGGRFRIRETRVAPNHLISARVEPLPADIESDDIDPLCRKVLQAIVDKVGADRFPAPLRLDDAAWIGYRLAEVLPIEAGVRQELLELTSAARRLERVHALLVKQGIAGPA
jgi:hypothetical protein